MLEAPETEQLRTGMARLQPIWATFVLSLGFYLFICHQVGPPEPREGKPAGAVRNVLAALAVGEAAAIPYLRKRMLASVPRPPAPRSPSVAGPPARPGAAARHPAVARYTTVVAVSAALAESIGVYGMVLFFLGAGYRSLYAFAIPSALLLFAYRPKMEELENLAVAMKKGAGG